MIQNSDAKWTYQASRRRFFAGEPEGFSGEFSVLFPPPLF
jgi:hypothetical protein